MFSDIGIPFFYPLLDENGGVTLTVEARKILISQAGEYEMLGVSLSSFRRIADGLSSGKRFYFKENGELIYINRFYIDRDWVSCFDVWRNSII